MLDHHLRNRPEHSLAGVFGDGYLISHNSIYRRVREFITAEKIEFSNDVPKDVVVMPLGQLELFLSSKKIFYFDNVQVLKDVEAKAPKLISWESMSAHLKRNMIFHESCHFLARSEFQKHLDSKKKPSVLQVILEESFANSCELLAIKDMNDSQHKNFYEFNSYIFVPEVRNLIHDLTDQLGFEKVLRWSMLCYTYSNYLYDSIPEKDLPRILKLIGIEPKVHSSTLKQLKALGKIAFLLNPEFKTATTAFYLIYHGFAKGLKELHDAEFLIEIEKNPNLKNAVFALSESVV